MKIFLCDFSSTEFIQVAAELKKRGAEILYWTGFKEKFNEVSKDKQNYPQTIFHIILDAVRGMPPADIDDSEFSPPSCDLIREMLECESITLTMMNRMDFNNMPFVQKKHLYYKYLQYWDGVLKKFKPEAVIFGEVPHVVYNFVLYSLAKKYNILTVMFNTNHLWGWQNINNDYKIGDENLLREYKKIENEKHGPDELCPELRDYYKKVIDSEYDATPIYNKELKSRTQRISLFLPKWRSVVGFCKEGGFFRAVRDYFSSIYNSKKQPLSLDEKNDGGLAGLFYLWKIGKIKNSFIKEYIGLQVAPDFNKKYIYFPLHYQPERTTSPLGGFYADQLLTARTLAVSVPDDWLIYIKEHLSQWSKFNSRAHLWRYKNYYKELAKLKNVRLVPVETPSYDLINNAAAVATVTGTAGWEALSRSKPVLIFGYPWYMDCDGAFRINGVPECMAAISKIAAGFKPDSQKVLNFFIAFGKTVVRTSHQLQYQFYQNVTAEESIKNITEAIWGELIKIKN